MHDVDILKITETFLNENKDGNRVGEVFVNYFTGKENISPFVLVVASDGDMEKIEIRGGADLTFVYDIICYVELEKDSDPEKMKKQFDILDYCSDSVFKTLYSNAYLNAIRTGLGNPTARLGTFNRTNGTQNLGDKEYGIRIIKLPIVIHTASYN